MLESSNSIAVKEIGCYSSALWSILDIIYPANTSVWIDNPFDFYRKISEELI